jgi:hypothetical protein
MQSSQCFGRAVASTPHSDLHAERAVLLAHELGLEARGHLVSQRHGLLE